MYRFISVSVVVVLVTSTYILSQVYWNKSTKITKTTNNYSWIEILKT